MTMISKQRFEILCRRISPDHIRSLTLYNNEQISLFLSQVRLRELTRLHSIHLDGIDEFQLNYLLKRIHLDLLQSFSIKIGKYDNRRKKTTGDHLSTIIQQSNLRNLDLHLQNNRLSDITWSRNPSIECLTITGNTIFVEIMSCLPRLNRLIIQEIDVNIDEMESFLSLSPSIIYLKITGNINGFDGKRWEEFVQVTLPHLDRFQFSIICKTSDRQSEKDLDTLLQPFSSSFWIEYKKWFVSIEIDPDNPNSYEIYSIPSWKCSLHSKKVSRSTSNEYFDRNDVQQLNLQLPISSSNLPSFPRVQNLQLDLHRKLSIDLEDSLWKKIDLSNLISIKITSSCLNKGNENVLCELFEQCAKLSSVIIESRSSYYEIYPYLKKIQFLDKFPFEK